MNRLLAFYYGSHPDSHGRMLAEMLKQDDHWLEVCHNYIQWLFPTKEFSRVTPDAPILDKATIEAFRTDELLSNQSNANAGDCFGAIRNKPEVLPLIGKVAMTESEHSDFRFLTNNDKVTGDEERVAIGAYIEARKQCEIMWQPPHPDIAAARRTQVSNIERGSCC